MRKIKDEPNSYKEFKIIEIPIKKLENKL